ncbi:MAG: conjugal transfer protein TraD (plasmid) [Candidatus Algichlamydia australiensis]|nr:conjugal transfer protein TraD [Chlamydiales bacterium]
MTAVIERQKEKIALQKAKLEEKERRLRERERKQKTRKLIKIGELARTAGISDFSEKTLLGAFLQIALDMKDNSKVSNWNQLAINSQNKSASSSRIILSFPSPPPLELKEALKSLGFKLNTFRDEWYGVADKKAVTERLNGFDVKIEVVNG